MRERLVGRGGDLSRLGIGLDEAVAGRGGVWLLTGEAGIGKTRLAEEVAALALERDVDCHWGRCWEGGGAPSFWPWIQVLRGLLRRRPNLTEAAGSEAARALIGTLVPEHVETADDVPKLDPEQQRFRLFDAVASILFAAAADAPQVVLLEDLHAADASSVQLLDFVARQIDSAPLFVLATYRDQDAERTVVGSLLAKVARIAHRTPLSRLAEADVRSLLEGRDDAMARRVFEASEGNPLFVVEVARLLERHRSSKTVPLSEGIRTVIREHLSTVDDDTFELLQAASILGREVRLGRLGALVDRSPQDVAVALAPAVDTGLLEPIGPDCQRFGHILMREVLHADLPPQTRMDHHLKAAAILESEKDPARWSELLVHYLEAGPAAADQAVEAACHAAEHAMRQLAFGDAATFYATAISSIARDAERVRRTELLLKQGRAQLLGGQVDEGKAACLAAAELARELERPDLFARAALELGGIFVLANVDAALVKLLEEALELLGEEPSALRAQVMARYAAALQPAPDVAVPIAIGRDAIEMARAFDDPPALLATMRSAVSAMMDLSDPSLRRPLNEEYIALAKRLGVDTEVLRGHLRLAMDTLELGDVDAMHTSVRAAQKVGQTLDHPFYRWRAAGLAGAEAASRGRFDEAVSYGERAKAFAYEAKDASAALTLAMYDVGLALVREDDDQLMAALPILLERCDDNRFDSAFATVTAAGALSRIEAVEDPRAKPTARDVRAAIAFLDPSLMMALADVAFAHGDREIAEGVKPRLEAATQTLVSWGLLGLCCDGPLARARALVAATLGDRDTAVRELERALEISTSAGLVPNRARVLYDLARISEQTAYAAEARAAAEGAGMSGLVRRITATFTEAPAVAPARAASTGFEMRPEGEVWLVVTPRGSFHLKRTKGVDLLAKLVAEAGREHHVLDLVTDNKRDQVDDRDAGPALDDRARATYRDRLRAIEAELDEAETWADVGRAERLREEQEALTAQLAAAFGLSGRARPTGAAAERARVNVQRRLKDAIRRVGQHDAEAAKNLERAVVTGMYCRYDP